MLGILRRDKGQDLVEYALIFPVLMLLILGIIDFSIVVFAYSTIASGAREGARAGLVPTNSTCDAACRLAEADAAALNAMIGIDNAQLTGPTASFSGTTIRVEVAYNAPLLTGPVIAAVGGGNTIPLSAVAIMERE